MGICCRGGIPRATVRPPIAMAFTCARTGQVTPLVSKGWDKSSTSKPISQDAQPSNSFNRAASDDSSRPQENITQPIRLASPDKTAHRPTNHPNRQSPISFRGFEQNSPLSSSSDSEFNLGTNVPASRQQPTVASSVTRGAGPQMTRHHPSPTWLRARAWYWRLPRVECRPAPSPLA